MQAKLLTLSLALLCAVRTDAAAPCVPSPLATPQELFDHHLRRLNNCRGTIDTSDFPEEMTLPQLLAAVDAQLPVGEKLHLTIDEKGFGQDYKSVATAKLRMVPFRAHALSVIKGALYKLPHMADFGVRPTGIVITRPQLTAYRTVIDIRDVLPHLAELVASRPNWAKVAEKRQGADLLVAVLAADVDLRE